MKIAMLSFNIVGRGTYLRALKLGAELTRIGHTVTLLATNESGGELRETMVDGVKVVSVPDLLRGSLRSGWDVYDTLRRISWLRGQKFDIAHAFESRPTAIYPALYLKDHGAALLTDWCDWFGKGGSVEERPNPVLRAVLRPVETFYEEHFRTRALATTAICTTLFGRALQLGVPEKDILLLPNGFDNPDIHPIDRAEACQALGLSANDFIIGYVGAAFTRDTELMVQAFEQTLQRIPTARLIHIGRTNYDLPASNRVLKTGTVDDRTLNLYLAACNIGWLPLRDSNANRGRFPLKLSNMMAAGRPVVATAVGDVATFLERNPVGLLATDTPDSIAEQTVELHRHPKLAEAMGRAAYAVAIDPQNSWVQRVKDLEQLYHRVLETKLSSCKHR